jgi:hypothetical protein
MTMRTSPEPKFLRESERFVYYESIKWDLKSSRSVGSQNALGKPNQKLLRSLKGLVQWYNNFSETVFFENLPIISFSDIEKSTFRFHGKKEISCFLRTSKHRQNVVCGNKEGGAGSAMSFTVNETSMWCCVIYCHSKILWSKILGYTT